MRDGLTLPLVVENRDGDILFALLINEKGYRKSIENNELWIINPDTGRLLPYDGEGVYISIEGHGTWYSAVLDLDKNSDNKESQADKIEVESPEILTHLYNVIHQRKIDMPEGSYTTHLFEKGLEKIKKKTGEEAIELILAEEREEIIYESADLIYHMMVLLEEHGINIEEVLAELKRREG
ncbi:phosphoribosyl-ATP diphosphatase [Thiospirochaeta perfilievii]|uniref:Phosphoribosyl-ATP pyrophosphatase n=1 Tax=Thiospirochaeta perfilievii TaxID=252967 RepID=A0A5C1QAU7_9SPIO|nr:phosphoribosyl-ATP diphosphatase [Thiospirochaeta perfilievii]QEN04641.1 phosphoribosyl-ATP diphosphatase [Thiospirochaeta perfilievii]